MGTTFTQEAFNRSGRLWAALVLATCIAPLNAITYAPRNINITGDQIYQIATGSGVVWGLANQNTLVELNANSGSVVGTFTDSRMTDAYFGHMSVDATGNVWIPDANASAIFEFNPLSSTFTKFTSIGGAGLHNPSAVSLDSNGQFWVANTFNQNILEFATPSTLEAQYALTFRSNYQPVDTVWVGSKLLYTTDGGHLCSLNKNTPGNNLACTPADSITGGGTLGTAEFLQNDAHGNAYVSASNHLYKFDGTLGSWTLITDTYTGFSSNAAFAFDSAGNLWTGGIGATAFSEWSTGAPEPSPLFLIAPALAALAFARRRRRLL